MTSDNSYTGGLREIGAATEAQAVADLVTQVTEFGTADAMTQDTAQPGDVLVAVGANKNGPTIVTADLEQWRDRPRRRKGHAVLHRLGSFTGYAGRHWLEGSAIYVDSDARTVTAIFDEHGEQPGWREFSAAYVPHKTREYAAWLSIADTSLTQDRLAEHIADWRHTIIEPDAADVYEMAQAFEATVNADFAQGSRLATGARQLVYKEDVAAKSGDLEIPESLTLSVQLYDDPFCPSFPLVAALRFTIREGSLRFRVVLEQPEALEAQYFDSVVAELENRSYDVFYGVC